jgi:hypothetical protein
MGLAYAEALSHRALVFTEIVSDDLPALHGSLFYGLFKTVCGAGPPRRIRLMANLFASIPPGTDSLRRAVR